MVAILPPCSARCPVTVVREPGRYVIWVQHGEDPEARAAFDAATATARQVARWLLRAHREQEEGGRVL